MCYLIKTSCLQAYAYVMLRFDLMYIVSYVSIRLELNFTIFNRKTKKNMSFNKIIN